MIDKKIAIIETRTNGNLVNINGEVFIGVTERNGNYVKLVVIYNKGTKVGRSKAEWQEKDGRKEIVRIYRDKGKEANRPQVTESTS